ncbi:MULTISPECIES: hypothetical protein [Mycolicibacterium]|uniref:Uncharacterized protein n=1 Tax=Mycolicibacterium senegalense TaxID=1796 RepID=A0ABR5FMM7_9MYCO|nr:MULTISPECIES: hypothetical protein [Mycolicibacterium]KLI09381.1 hypothetical protein AA982_04940 [Mycolicibacterium senegalense]KLO47773.1 hypothetical protein ABW05_31960 [Mycolicibacterium senegalense]OMB74243.1 hypothetical protein A5741_04645 [Mycolicibacterium conceptionense]
MSHTEQVKPIDLREGDPIDLAPLLNDPSSHPWTWQPFGADDRNRAEAIVSARGMAQYELAVVESVERIDGDKVVVYNDQINVTVAADRLITRTVG